MGPRRIRRTGTPRLGPRRNHRSDLRTGNGGTRRHRTVHPGNGGRTRGRGSVGTLVQCRTRVLPVRTTPRVVRPRPELVAPAPRLIVRRSEQSVPYRDRASPNAGPSTAGTGVGAFRVRRPHRHHTETSGTPTNAATEEANTSRTAIPGSKVLWTDRVHAIP